MTFTKTKPLLWLLVPLSALAVIYVLKPGPEISLDGPAPSTPAAESQRTAPPSDVPQEAASTIFFLLDASGSFHDSDPEKSNLQFAIPVLRRTAEHWLERAYLPPPTRFLVGTIGSASLDQRPVCDFFAVSTSNALAPEPPGRLRADLGECERAIAGVKPEGNTDINGALKYASLVLRGRARAPRGVVLISDMLNDIPADQQPAVPDLQGICVALIVDVGGAEDARAGQALDRRLNEWLTRLKGWGAHDVDYWHRLGFTPNELGKFFQACRV